MKDWRFTQIQAQALLLLILKINQSRMSMISDISGKQIIDLKNLNTETKNIDISNLSKGIYFISINNQVIKKLIKI